MERPTRQYLGKSLSTGQLMQLASQVRQQPCELLSLTATERMWDPSEGSGMSYSSPSTSGFLSRKPSPAGLGAQSNQLALLRPQGPGSGSSTGLHLPPKNRMVWSQQEFRIDDMQDDFRCDRGVSSRTRQENCSQQQAAARLDSSCRGGSKRTTQGGQHGLVNADSAVTDSAEDRKHTLDMLEAEFKEEVKAMENQMADLNKSLQMSRYSKEDKESKANEDREAKKRRREAEIRKARLKEKDTRDPHRKVQLKIENKRRFEMDTIQNAGIPTMNVSFKGQGDVRMVDVQGLRQKCQGLTQGIHSVPKLVEMQQRRERCPLLQQSSPKATGSMMMSTSMPNFGSRLSSDSTSQREASK